MEVRLIYASQAREPMDDAGLVAMLLQARTNNERLNLSGLLMYCGRSFLQVLEGRATAVDSIYQKISVDPRHMNLRLLLRAVISRRNYGTWTMGFEPVASETLVETIPGFKPATEFPLVSADLIKDAAIAELVLDRYQRNFARPLSHSSRRTP